MPGVLLVAVPVMEHFDGKVVTAYMDSYRNNPHLGIYLLASVLREHFKTDILDLAEVKNWTREDVLEASRGFAVVGISGNSMNWATARMVGRWIKEDRKDAILIAGGPHPTMFPNEVLSEGIFDYAVRGEAEETIVPLVRALLKGDRTPNVPGVSWRGRKAGIRKITAESFERLPEPAWGLLKSPRSFLAFPVETARGCRSSCRFCAIPSHKSWRGRSPERTLKSLAYAETFCKETGTGKITFTDDCTTTDGGRLISLGRLLEGSPISPRLIMDGRVIDILGRPDLLETLNPYVESILVGAECGYDEGLRRAGKPITTAKIEKSVQALCSYGNPGRFVYSFIIGFPWETVEQCRKTIQFAEHLILSYGISVYLQWFTLVPGSKLWHESGDSLERCRNFGYFSDLDWWLGHNKLSIRDIADISESVFALIALNAGIFQDGRFGFAAPMALRKKFSDWEAVLSAANS